MKSLKGKTALITGAGKEIGRAVAIALAQEGVNICLLSRANLSLEAFAKEIKSYGVKASIATAEATDIHEIIVAVEKLEEEVGVIDIFINSEEAATFSPFFEFDPIQWELNLKANLLGLNYLTRAILPSMVKNKTGDIINISTTLHPRSMIHHDALNTSQTSYSFLSESLMEEVNSHNIRFSALSTTWSEEEGFAEESISLADDFPQYLIAHLRGNPVQVSMGL